MWVHGSVLSVACSWFEVAGPPAHMMTRPVNLCGVEEAGHVHLLRF
jgi:hypothetical protein